GRRIMSPGDFEKRDCDECGEAAAPMISAADLARINEGIAAADRGDFATEEEVQAEFARWRSLRR
ncbi:MAG: hypothetical protein WAK25_10910, partial [Acidobacteriaceae bacterium]